MCLIPLNISFVMLMNLVFVWVMWGKLRFLCEHCLPTSHVI